MHLWKNPLETFVRFLVTLLISRHLLAYTTFPTPYPPLAPYTFFRLLLVLHTCHRLQLTLHEYFPITSHSILLKSPMPDPANVFVTLTSVPPNGGVPPSRTFAAAAMPPPQYCENDANPPPPFDGVPPGLLGLGQSAHRPPSPAPNASASMPGKSFAVLIEPCATNNRRSPFRYKLSTPLLTFCHLTRSLSYGHARILPRLLCRLSHAYANLPRPPTPTPTPTPTSSSTSTRTNSTTSTTSCRKPSPSCPTTPLRASWSKCLARWVWLHTPRYPRQMHHPLHQRRFPPLRLLPATLQTRLQLQRAPCAMQPDNQGTTRAAWVS